MNASPRICCRVVVHGRVQGVAFRWGTAARAREVGACGWVRNRSDGTVEAVFEGAPEAVEAMVAFCRVGPSWARVARVERIEEEAGNLTAFEVR